MSNGEIVVENLSKQYPGGVVAVEDVSLRVEAGRIFGFLGPNGAGKSTTPTTSARWATATRAICGRACA